MKEKEQEVDRELPAVTGNQKGSIKDGIGIQQMNEESLNISLWKASRDTWKLRMRCEDITNSWNEVTTKLLH